MMKNLALVAFSGQTHLDFIGFYDCMTRLKVHFGDFKLSVCALEHEIADNFGLKFIAEKRSDLSEFDAVFVPGGMATRALKDDVDFISWLKTTSGAKYKFSVCTGSLLFGAAGFLRGLSATTHPFCHDLLAPYCAKVLSEKIVCEDTQDGGKIITAGGVSSSVELGLFVVEIFGGKEFAQKTRLAMDYLRV